MAKEIGVIQEQGFVAGNNLGFKSLTEEEKKKIENDKKEENK